MAQGDATSADVPGKYDLVVNGKGYMLLQTLEPSLPFRTHRAIYTYSPTFVERQNVSNSYGDQAQDFFLTIRQRDWSLGEQQKFYRTGSDGRYWMGTSVDVSIPGQVKLAPAIGTLSLAGSVCAGARLPTTQRISLASTTHVYDVDVDGTITDEGAHGLGATPSRYGVCQDGNSVFISTTTAGTVGVRKLTGGGFSTFSASGADSLAFLNNTLYGFRLGTADLVRWDTSGTLTSLFTWKDAAGAAFGSPNGVMLIPYGGKLLIQFIYAQEAAELWIYDGVAPSRLHVFPENFIASEMDVLYGVAYISGSFMKPVNSSNVVMKPAVFFYDGSQVGELWTASDFNTSSVSLGSNAVGPHPALGILNGRLIFTDDTTNHIMAFDPAVGGVSSIGAYSAGGDSTHIISSAFCQVHTRNQSTAYLIPAATYPSSGTVISSLIDFDSSLTKVLRGVTVEFDAASDGNGGSVDLAYQLNSVAGAFTTLITGATSGTEAPFPASTTAHSVSVRVTLNKGTSTAGPTLKSMSVRGAPQLQTFRNREYTLDLSGIGFKDPVRLADGTTHTLSGHEQADNLNTAITSAVPVSVSDRFCNQSTCTAGTTTVASFVAMCEPSASEIYDTAEGWDNPKSPGGYIAKLTLREV